MRQRIDFIFPLTGKSTTSRRSPLTANQIPLSFETTGQLGLMKHLRPTQGCRGSLMQSSLAEPWGPFRSTRPTSWRTPIQCGLVRLCRYQGADTLRHPYTGNVGCGCRCRPRDLQAESKKEKYITLWICCGKVGFSLHLSCASFNNLHTTSSIIPFQLSAFIVLLDYMLVGAAVELNFASPPLPY